jgi:hypothetical protein
MEFPLIRAVGHAADIAPAIFTGPRIENLFMKAGLSRFQPPPRPGAQRYGKDDLVASTLYAAQTAVSRGDEGAEEGLKEFIRLVAEKAEGNDFEGLLESVRSAGFDLHFTDGGIRLLPLDEPHAPLSQAITALESDLDGLGMSIAMNHYRQAVDSLVDGRLEAANGQMRAMLEAVIIHVAMMKGFVPARQGDGGKAIRYLVEERQLLPPKDGGDYIRGLWNITHTNGPHPGTSPAGEAYFRVQAMTSAARYLIDRFYGLYCLVNNESTGQGIVLRAVNDLWS